uniref:Carboxypeptidase regulatory-like domain-containing protein n=1 Tax=Steinernema glaseri TaxID=37863 RepID=A0A1I8AU23_9BILA
MLSPASSVFSAANSHILDALGWGEASSTTWEDHWTGGESLPSEQRRTDRKGVATWQISFASLSGLSVCDDHPRRNNLACLQSSMSLQLFLTDSGNITGLTFVAGAIQSRATEPSLLHDLCRSLAFVYIRSELNRFLSSRGFMNPSSNSRVPDSMKVLAGALALVLLATLADATVFTCGGFIKSDVPIDFSQIRVKLFTPEGNLKHDAEVMPNSGYFMIPVYNKASYEIKAVAPAGWNFAPASVSVKIDGETDACTLAQDINFSLDGFSIEGHVKSGESGGPEGLSLTLSTEDGKQVAETKTGPGGYYSFNAKSGRYLVSTGHGSTQCIERGKAVVEVRDKPVVVSPGLKISGHRLSLAASNQGKPLADVFVTVASDSSLSTLATCLPLPEGVHLEGKFLCTLKTDKTGVASLPCVPPGKYSAVAHFTSPKSSAVQFEFDSSPRTFQMESEALEVVFHVVGFSSRGRVLSQGKGISGALVKLDGTSTGVLSDANGFFVLGKLAEGAHTFEAEKEHMQFTPLVKKVSIEDPLVGDILVSGIDVCGSIQLEQGSAANRIVHLTNSATKKTLSATSGPNGDFCINVAPGAYVVTPADKNIAMTPKSRQITVASEPIKGVVFTQFTASATISLKCLGSCDDVVVELSSESGQVKTEKGAASVTFSGLSPDSYKVRVKDNGLFCWEASEQRFQIERSDVSDVVFKQAGFSAQVSVSHAAKLNWEKSGDKSVKGALDVTEGLTHFCVPSAGSYHFSLDSCHRFEKDEYSFSVPLKKAVVADAASAAVTVLVKTKENVPKTDLSMLVKSADGKEETIEVSAVRGKEYEFVFYVPQSAKGSPVTFVPQSANYLFSPTSFSFDFDGSCKSSVVSFEADKGVYLEGRVTPPVAGVQISAPHKTDGNLVFKAVTDEEGKYRIGPVRRLQDFEVSASLEGYQFQPTEKQGVLSSVRLSQLRIAAIDSDNQKPLGAVLVSLSGSGYRSNNMTDSNGRINFIGLAPGQYFLQPILREYRFEPSMIPITIKEGEVEQLVLAGIRFAYSVYGKVAQIAGEPVSAVKVEAISEQCDNLQAEDVTAADGSFRVRELHPGCAYRISLKEVEGGRLDSYPAHFDVTVQDDDILEKDFFLTYFEQKQMEVFGSVDFQGGVKPPTVYHVGLYRNDEFVQLTSVTWPSTVFFFANLSVDGSAYSIRLETEGALARTDVSSVEFVADTTFKAVKLVVKAQRRSSDVDIPKSSFLGLLLLAAVTLAIFNHSKILPLVAAVVQRVKERVHGLNGQAADSRRSKLRR